MVYQGILKIFINGLMRKNISVLYIRKYKVNDIILINIISIIIYHILVKSSSIRTYGGTI